MSDKRLAGRKAPGTGVGRAIGPRLFNASPSAAPTSRQPIAP
ncbi:MAG: hypothetical protein CM1200mP20_03910 [Pseudomonadota bacterium]|nr:MAG: hypothetical protein CM1200mP20_03910 [Pseudomonadota bacterium]